MGEDPFDWTSFWDLASPARAAQALVAFYGADAALAAAYSGLAAHADGREDDYRFWLAVFATLRGTSTGRAKEVPESPPLSAGMAPGTGEGRNDERGVGSQKYQCSAPRISVKGLSVGPR